jgi:hypothetical protein
LPNPDIFLSYSHDDRDRIEILASALEAEGWVVWWDDTIPVGSHYRDVIGDALRAATSVIVVWSTSSIRRDFVLDEAQEGMRRGVLRPARIDEVEPPLGYGQVQYADLVGWSGGDHPELRKLVSAIRNLIAHWVKPEDREWSDLKSSVEWTAQGASTLRQLTVDVETAVDLFRVAPGAMDKLALALREIYKTYKAVLEAISQFLAPRSGVELVADDFAALARGRLAVTVASTRGHCTAIGLAYWSHGGIRSALLAAGKDKLGDLDDVFWTLSRADGDVFDEMTQIARSLAGESSAIANLLLGGDREAARARLDEDALQLQSLEADLNQQISELLRFTGEIGITLDD